MGLQSMIVLLAMVYVCNYSCSTCILTKIIHLHTPNHRFQNKLKSISMVPNVTLDNQLTQWYNVNMVVMRFEKCQNRLLNGEMYSNEMLMKSSSSCRILLRNTCNPDASLRKCIDVIMNVIRSALNHLKLSKMSADQCMMISVMFSKGDKKISVPCHKCGSVSSSAPYCKIFQYLLISNILCCNSTNLVIFPYFSSENGTKMWKSCGTGNQTNREFPSSHGLKINKKRASPTSKTWQKIFTIILPNFYCLSADRKRILDANYTGKDWIMATTGRTMFLCSQHREKHKIMDHDNDLENNNCMHHCDQTLLSISIWLSHLMYFL